MDVVQTPKGIEGEQLQAPPPEEVSATAEAPPVVDLTKADEGQATTDATAAEQVRTALAGGAVESPAEAPNVVGQGVSAAPALPNPTAKDVVNGALQGGFAVAEGNIGEGSAPPIAPQTADVVMPAPTEVDAAATQGADRTPETDPTAYDVASAEVPPPPNPEPTPNLEVISEEPSLEVAQEMLDQAKKYFEEESARFVTARRAGNNSPYIFESFRAAASDLGLWKGIVEDLLPKNAELTDAGSNPVEAGSNGITT